MRSSLDRIEALGHRGDMDTQGLDVPDLISVPEAARHLGRHPDTVHRWISMGAIPLARTLPSGRKLVHRKDIEYLMGANRTSVASAPLTEAQAEFVRTVMDRALRLLVQSGLGGPETPSVPEPDVGA
jgi:hypothetical protein